MKTERIIELADHLDSEVLDLYHPRDRNKAGANPLFSMLVYSEKNAYNNHAEECGTCACIAGHTIHLWGRGIQPSDFKHDARMLLGLEIDIADELFEPCDHMEAWYFQDDPDDPAFISSHRAARVLRHLAETGEVDWYRFPNEYSKQSEEKS